MCSIYFDVILKQSSNLMFMIDFQSFKAFIKSLYFALLGWKTIHKWLMIGLFLKDRN